VLIFGVRADDNREMKSDWFIATEKSEPGPAALSASFFMANTSGEMDNTDREKFDSRDTRSDKSGWSGVSGGSAELREPQRTNTSREAYMGESMEDLRMRSIAL
jgi:hypothetical protein